MTRGKVRLVANIPAQARDWRNDERIWKWCRQHTLISDREHWDWIISLGGNKTIKMFGIEAMDGIGPHSTGWMPVGVCGLTSIDHVNQKAEFSLYIGPEHQRKGYGKDALWLLLHHGFSDLNLNRIWGESFEGNLALNLFDSLGMTREGLLKQTYFRDGKFMDSGIVAILRKDFYAQRTPHSGSNSKLGSDAFRITLEYEEPKPANPPRDRAKGKRQKARSASRKKAKD